MLTRKFEVGARNLTIVDGFDFLKTQRNGFAQTCLAESAAPSELSWLGFTRSGVNWVPWKSPHPPTGSTRRPLSPSFPTLSLSRLAPGEDRFLTSIPSVTFEFI